MVTAARPELFTPVPVSGAVLDLPLRLSPAPHGERSLRQTSLTRAVPSV